MAKQKQKPSITELIQDLKTQTEKYGHFDRKGQPGENSSPEREDKYFEVDASTVAGLLDALDELRGIVGKG